MIGGNRSTGARRLVLVRDSVGYHVKWLDLGVPAHSLAPASRAIKDYDLADPLAKNLRVAAPKLCTAIDFILPWSPFPPLPPSLCSSRYVVLKCSYNVD